LPSFWDKNFSSTVLKNEADPEDVDQGKQSWQSPEVRRHEEEKERCLEQGCWGPLTTSSSTYLPPPDPPESETEGGPGSLTRPPGDSDARGRLRTTGFAVPKCFNILTSP